MKSLMLYSDECLYLFAAHGLLNIRTDPMPEKLVSNCSKALVPGMNMSLFIV